MTKGRGKTSEVTRPLLVSILKAKVGHCWPRTTYCCQKRYDTCRTCKILAARHNGQGFGLQGLGLSLPGSELSGSDASPLVTEGPGRTCSASKEPNVSLPAKKPQAACDLVQCDV